MIRNFAGGLELLISLLESNDIKVLSYVCATVTEVAKNEGNLAVITDLGVVNYLAKLVLTVNKHTNYCTFNKHKNISVDA